VFSNVFVSVEWIPVEYPSYSYMMYYWKRKVTRIRFTTRYLKRAWKYDVRYIVARACVTGDSTLPIWRIRVVNVYPNKTRTRSNTAARTKTWRITFNAFEFAVHNTRVPPTHMCVVAVYWKSLNKSNPIH